MAVLIQHSPPQPPQRNKDIASFMIDFDTRPIGTDLMWSNIEDLGIDTPITSFVVYFYSVIVDWMDCTEKAFITSALSENTALAWPKTGLQKKSLQVHSMQCPPSYLINYQIKPDRL